MWHVHALLATQRLHQLPCASPAVPRPLLFPFARRWHMRVRNATTLSIGVVGYSQKQVQMGPRRRHSLESDMTIVTQAADVRASVCGHRDTDSNKTSILLE